MPSQMARDEVGVVRAVNERGVHFTYAEEWPNDLFEKRDGGTAAADLRTVSKGSSRGAGPKVKKGRVRGRGGAADVVNMCGHGQRAAQCTACRVWHCACPGSPAHVCQQRKEHHHG